MTTVALEWGAVLLGVIFLGGLGLGIVLPFRAKLPHYWLAAPAAGLIACSTSLTLAFSFGFSIGGNILVSTAMWGCVSLIIARREKASIPKAWLWPALAIILVTVYSTVVTSRAQVWADGPANATRQGTDTFGYSHIANWHVDHGPSTPPLLTPNRPFESWVNYGLSEARSGCYLSFAAVSYLSGESAFFTFDRYCALVLSVGILGMLGVFASEGWALVLLALAVLASSAIDLSRCGFLGKALAYPALLTVVGLILQYRPNRQWQHVTPMIVLTIGSCWLYSGIGVAVTLLMAWCGLPIVIALAKLRGESMDSVPLAASFKLTLGMAAFGILDWIGQPMPLADTDKNWFIAPLTGLDLDLYWSPQAMDSVNQYIIYLSLAAIGQITFLVLAWRKKMHLAFGMLLAPFPFLAIAALKDLRWNVMQLNGFLYPMAAAASVMVLVELRRGRRRTMLIAFTAFACIVGSRIPRIMSSYRVFLKTEVGEPHLYTKSDFDEIQRIVGDDVVEFAIADTYAALAAFVELGHRDVHSRMDKNTWKILVGYRDWSYRLLEEEPRYVLELREDMPNGSPSKQTGRELYRCRQFVLYEKN